jgi:CRISPR system Cascade subunit CasB
MSTPDAFIRYLSRLGANPRNRGRVAILRRGLASEPGTDVRTFPMVEAHVPTPSEWERTVYYLVAGLWASVNTASVLAAGGDAADDDEAPVPASGDGAAAGAGEVPTTRPAPRGRDTRSFGWAVAQLDRQQRRSLDEPTSIERRFVALLDADEEQLPHHLRQMVQLLRADQSIRIHWGPLLQDLRQWSYTDRRVQRRWARAFYSPGDDDTPDEDTPRDEATPHEGA